MRIFVICKVRGVTEDSEEYRRQFVVGMCPLFCV